MDMENAADVSRVDDSEGQISKLKQSSVGALGWTGGTGWGGRWEGLQDGDLVNPGRIHVRVQNHDNTVK